ncbi:MAG: DUF1304 domain-containing protein [Spirochaetales bacterium]|nr:DUF1304 domain-containing protein [Leptospiraceae bacterium]MCP5482084.1 DUF1304 domain-containing protein [Spirochaetales bacterium]MCP5484960.1 DUF1304 domain-containing protein [Spirochaetales bacterium]
MKLASKILIGLVALIHCYIMVLETLLWTTRGLAVFGMTAEYAEMTKVLALNQGWYNGVLAAGLIWTFFIKDIRWSRNVAYFFLAAVFVMGVVGTVSTGKINIVFVQSVPAFLGLLVTWLSSRSK